LGLGRLGIWLGARLGLGLGIALGLRLVGTRLGLGSLLV